MTCHKPPHHARLHSAAAARFVLQCHIILVEAEMRLVGRVSFFNFRPVGSVLSRPNLDTLGMDESFMVGVAIRTSSFSNDTTHVGAP